MTEQDVQEENNSVEEPVEPEAPAKQTETTESEASYKEKFFSIKESMDKLYAERDLALKKAAEYEQQEKQAKLKRLEEEGKHKEAYEMKLAEIENENKTLKNQILGLTRDSILSSELGGLDFKNNKAKDLAFKEISVQLVQDKDGNWVHESGATLKDFVKGYAESEEQSFLFKPKVNSGGGTSSNVTSNSPSSKRSLFEMTQAEVLKLANEGKL